MDFHVCSKNIRSVRFDCSTKMPQLLAEFENSCWGIILTFESRILSGNYDLDKFMFLT